MLTTLLLSLALAGPIYPRFEADTSKAPPRPASGPASRPAPASKPGKAPKPVGEPVLKRRHPGY